MGLWAGLIQVRVKVRVRVRIGAIQGTSFMIMVRDEDIKGL